MFKIDKGSRKPTKLCYDFFLYKTLQDLLETLNLFYAEKRASHTGLNNNIVSILDELLCINAIDKNEYNTLTKNILGDQRIL